MCSAAAHKEVIKKQRVYSYMWEMVQNATSDDEDFSSEDIDALYNLIDDSSTTANCKNSFHTGDHVWM